MSFQPELAKSNATSVPIHQVETNNYKVTVNNYNWKQSEKVYTHLVIFAHGISAHSFDMESLRNMMKFINPKV